MANEKPNLYIVGVSVVVAALLLWSFRKGLSKVDDAATGAINTVADWWSSVSLPEVVQAVDRGEEDVRRLYDAYGISTLSGHFNDGSFFAQDYAKAKIKFGTDTPSVSQILSVKALRGGSY